MNRRALFASAVLLLSVGTACHKPKPPPPAAAPPEAETTVLPARPEAGSGLIVAEIAGHRSAIIADEDDEAVRVVDLEKRTITSTTFLEGAPGQMIMANDGTLYVAVRGAAKVVALRFQADGGAHEIAQHATADEPYGLAITPDQKSVLVSTITTPRLEMLRAKDLTSVFSTVLPRDPRSIVVARDGMRAFVSHATGSQVSVVALGNKPGESHPVSLDMQERRRFSGSEMDVTSMRLDAFSNLNMGETGFQRSKKGVRPVALNTMQRTATQGFAMSRIGDEIVLPESMVMTTDGEKAPPEGYGSSRASSLSSHVPFVARINENVETLASKALGGPQDSRCFQNRTECIVPRAVADDGARLFIACLDSDEIMVVDPKEENEHAPECQKSFAERPRLKVENPTAVALTGNGEVIAWSSFTHTLTLLGKADAIPLTTVASKIEVPRLNPIEDEVALGRRLFHESGNRSISADGRACASCHVDGRDDGLVWPTPTGQRQTPMLAGRLQDTGPYGWNGEHATLAAHIASTVGNLQGAGLRQKEVDALAAYCMGMHATKPTMVKATLAERGKEIFHSADTSCSSCHQDEKHFTDGDTHALTKGKDSKAFDTPSLAFVGQTAPYFHDGRFATLDALVDGADGPHTAMGRTKQLSGDDKRALVAYLQTL